MSSYKYRCHDYSLITPFFKKIFVTPTLKFIPYRIPANIITIVSFVCALAAFILSMVIDYNNFFHKILIPFLIYLYAHGDHLDGMQAKRSKTSSELGEFCDHFLDIITTGLITLTLFNFFHIKDNFLLLLTLLANYTLHSTIMHEQNKTGWLVFDKIGSLEALLATIVIMAIASNQMIWNLFKSNILFEKPFIECALTIAALSTILSCITVIKRSGLSTTLLFHIIFSFYMFLFFHSQTYLADYLLIFIAYQVSFIASLIENHLLHHEKIKPNTLLSLAIVLLNFFHPIKYIILLYLCSKIFLIIFNVFTEFKQYWLWKNPREITDP
jgi:phosphatidylglycerophosphate synthase